jgi:hypothetical protein
MTIRVPVKPALLDWAEKRSGVAYAKIISKFKSFEDWKSGTKQPTLKQLESFANLTHTSVGYLFLSEPPDETIPIPDFRTRVNVEPGKVSPDLLDTIYICQQRQEWYRDYARLNREDPVPFIGTLSVKTDVIDAGSLIKHLSYKPKSRSKIFARLKNLPTKLMASDAPLVKTNLALSIFSISENASAALLSSG